MEAEKCRVCSGGFDAECESEQAHTASRYSKYGGRCFSCWAAVLQTCIDCGEKFNPESDAEHAPDNCGYLNSKEPWCLECWLGVGLKNDAEYLAETAAERLLELARLVDTTDKRARSTEIARRLRASAQGCISATEAMLRDLGFELPRLAESTQNAPETIATGASASLHPRLPTLEEIVSRPPVSIPSYDRVVRIAEWQKVH